MAAADAPNTKRPLPCTGSDRSVLADHLNTLAVWKILTAYADERIGSADAYRALGAIGCGLVTGQLEQLLDLAWADAKKLCA
jgi:hypothetical protein